MYIVLIFQHINIEMCYWESWCGRLLKVAVQTGIHLDVFLV